MRAKDHLVQHPASSSGQERLGEQVYEDKHAVMLPWFLALYELQDFLSLKWRLCVLQPVMDSSSVDLSNPF